MGEGGEGDTDIKSDKCAARSLAVTAPAPAGALANPPPPPPRSAPSGAACRAGAASPGPRAGGTAAAALNGSAAPSALAAIGPGAALSRSATRRRLAGRAVPCRGAGLGAPLREGSELSSSARCAERRLPFGTGNPCGESSAGSVASVGGGPVRKAGAA